MFNHPREVCMTYWEHLSFSMHLSYDFAKASIGAFVHALLPPLFLTHSTDTIQIITEELRTSGCRKEKQ